MREGPYAHAGSLRKRELLTPCIYWWPQVVKLREEIVNEGRRRRFMMAEEIEMVRIELERLRDEAVREVLATHSSRSPAPSYRYTLNVDIS